MGAAEKRPDPRRIYLSQSPMALSMARERAARLAVATDADTDAAGRERKVQALLAASYLDADELDVPVEVMASPRRLSATEIADEVRRRLIELAALGDGQAAQKTTV
jgi:hypothetical protein